MHTIAIVRGEATAQRVAAMLIERSAYFALTPLPDDAWCFEFKCGEGLQEAIVAKAAEPPAEAAARRIQPVTGQRAPL